MNVKQRQRHKIWMREWRSKNPDYQHHGVSSTKEYKLQYHRKYYQEHKEEQKERREKYYQDHKEYFKEKADQWYKDNKNKVSERHQKLRMEVLEHYGMKCQCRGCNETRHQFLALDHVNNDGNIHLGCGQETHSL